jgi:hypothetical protein
MVDGNPVNPSRDRGRTAKTIRIPVYLEKDILRQVLGFRQVFDETEAYVMDLFAVPLYESSESLVVSTSGCPEKLAILDGVVVATCHQRAKAAGREY